MSLVEARPDALIVQLLGPSSFVERAQSLREAIYREAALVNRCALIAEQSIRDGDKPAIDVESMRERLGHLGEAQRLIAALAPYEQVVRAFLAFLAHQGHCP